MLELELVDTVERASTALSFSYFETKILPSGVKNDQQISCKSLIQILSSFGSLVISTIGLTSLLLRNYTKFWKIIGESKSLYGENDCDSDNSGDQDL